MLFNYVQSRQSWSPAHHASFVTVTYVICPFVQVLISFVRWPALAKRDYVMSSTMPANVAELGEPNGLRIASLKREAHIAELTESIRHARLYRFCHAELRRVG
jgi:hypothetical protein